MERAQFLELVAGHALHALSPADQALLRGQLRKHPAYQRDVDVAVETAVSLAAGVSPVVPPPHLRAAILDRAARTPQQS